MRKERRESEQRGENVMAERSTSVKKRERSGNVRKKSESEQSAGGELDLLVQK
jgi:hypothetical protein